MEAQDPLSELADIHLPPEPGLWPPALGWWVVALLLAAAAGYGLLRALAELARRRRRAAALAELAACRRRYQERAGLDSKSNQAGLAFLAELNALLRRVALLHEPDSGAAALQGEAWLRYLDASGDTQAFTQGPGQVLAEGPYRPRFEGDPDALHALARDWILRRYRPSRPARSGATAAALPPQPEAQA